MRRYHTPWFCWSIMMATHWTVGIMSVMFLIVALEFGGTAMMTIYQNIEIYLMGFIIEKITNPHFKKTFNGGFVKDTVCCLYQNKPFNKTQL